MHSSLFSFCFEVTFETQAPGGIAPVYKHLSFLSYFLQESCQELSWAELEKAERPSARAANEDKSQNESIVRL